MTTSLEKQIGPALAAIAFIVSAGACSSGQTTSFTPASSGDAPTSVAAPSPSDTGTVTFTNPVINADFPDPFISLFDGVYYAYATGTGGKLIQVSSSSDLVHWALPAEALYRVPRWMSGDTWAPEVYQTSAGYVLYYSGRYPAVKRSNGEGALCISAAVSAKPGGTFTDKSTQPLECQPELGGDIDVTAFVDNDGTRYLIWKNDGNCCAIPTRFWIQKLSDDGLTLAGDGPTDLGLTNDAAWEDGVIEAPDLLFKDGTYYLFYSANRYDTVHYAVGYATSTTVTGPYVDAAENPILTNGAPAVGPGHESVFADAKGDLWMAYHAWDVSGVGYAAGGRRAMWIDPLNFSSGKPDVLGPDASPQPAP